MYVDREAQATKISVHFATLTDLLPPEAVVVGRTPTKVQRTSRASWTRRRRRHKGARQESPSTEHPSLE